jgi:hypothetical protein
MTINEAFNIVLEAVEKKFKETAKKWGFTLRRKSDGSWICWEIVELYPYEIVSAARYDPFIRLWRPTSQVRRIYPKHFSPEELEHVVGLFVSRALERLTLVLAHRELRNISGIDYVWRGSSALKVYVNSETFFLKFKLGKKFWSWKVVSDEGATVAIIRRPLSENPIKSLCEAAKYFTLLAI